MTAPRTPLQGTRNILRFNWHFYTAAAAGLVLLGAAGAYAPPPWSRPAPWLLAALGWLTAGSLLVSAYVYDGSALYHLPWLDELGLGREPVVVNVHAGFDETSALLRARLGPGARLRVFDFYDPARHTEPSIRRARAAYPPYPGTEAVRTRHLPLPDAAADLVVLMMAAHEIRDEAERTAFFREVARVLRGGGRAVVVEHLRDAPNVLAYSAGALHFFSRRSWRRVFRAAGLRLVRERRLTPFVAVFELTPDGAPA